MQNLRKEARFPYAGTKNLLLFLWSTLVYLSMKYRVNGIEIPLDRKETAAAKRMVAKFMEEVEKNSKDTGNTSLYFTTLILMQVLSQEALDHISNAMIMNILFVILKMSPFFTVLRNSSVIYNVLCGVSVNSKSFGP